MIINFVTFAKTKYYFQNRSSTDNRQGKLLQRNKFEQYTEKQAQLCNKLRLRRHLLLKRRAWPRHVFPLFSCFNIEPCNDISNYFLIFLVVLVFLVVFDFLMKCGIRT